MSLYPSLEDMKVDHMAKAQIQTYISQNSYPCSQNEYPYPDPTSQITSPGISIPTNGAVVQMYPALQDYMGLELTEAVIAHNMPEYKQIAIAQQRSLISSHTGSNLIAPISGQTLGLQKAQVSHGIRELTLCKDKDGKVGLRVKPIDNGIFVCLVIDKSPAALVGLRFGDQILQIDGVTVAGFNMDQVHNLFRKSAVNGISVIVRDRPFERTLTLHKDSTGHVGFQFKNGKINNIVKDSSAARNGVLIQHQLLEVDGQNVVGLKDKDISKVIDSCEGVVTITVIPTFIYDHMIKKMAGSLLKGLMDHSIPNL